MWPQAKGSFVSFVVCPHVAQGAAKTLEHNSHYRVILSHDKRATGHLLPFYSNNRSCVIPGCRRLISYTSFDQTAIISQEEFSLQV